MLWFIYMYLGCEESHFSFYEGQSLLSLSGSRVLVKVTFVFSTLVLVTLWSELLTFCMHKNIILKTRDHDHAIPSSALIWKYFSLTTIYRKWIILQLFLLFRGTWRSRRNVMQNRIFIRVSIFSWSGMLQSG